MHNFYKKAIVVFLCLTALTLLAVYLCIQRAFQSDQFLPADKSAIPWSVSTESDEIEGGFSSIQVNDANTLLDYSFVLRQGFDYPYASIKLGFNNDEGEPLLVDFSNYSSLSINVRCESHNIFMFIMYTLDQKLSKAADTEVYRPAGKFFSCEEYWKRVDIDLKHLEVPDWWISLNELNPSDREYNLDQVSGLAFGTSLQSPHETLSTVKISELVFNNNDWRYLYVFSVFVLLLWGAYLLWLLRQHTLSLIADIKEKLHTDNPPMTYQPSSLQPQNNGDTEQVLNFIATAYADADLSLDTIVTKLGINRAKINDILKSECGYTFIPYLNKLRLTEAARLLSEKVDANVAEIAYSVGYNNVPYFNKLFKSEFGCTPKTFKKVYKH